MSRTTVPKAQEHDLFGPIPERQITDFLTPGQRDDAQHWNLLRSELLNLQALYHELLFAVARKFDDETRHQTALRYIRQAEANATKDPAVAKTTP